MGDTTTRHDAADWSPNVAPAGASEWEAQEARRHWKSAVNELDDVIVRATYARRQLLDHDPQRHLHINLQNAAGSLALAAEQVASYVSVCNGTVHRQAMARRDVERSMEGG